MGIICCFASNSGDTEPGTQRKRSAKKSLTDDKIFKSKQEMHALWAADQASFKRSSFKSTWDSSLSNENIFKIYKIQEIIGEGFVGTVRRATLIKDPEKIFAVKSISKKKSKKSPDAESHIKHEMEIIKETDCPYIVQFFECYEDSDCYYLVLEYCEGGDLVKLVEKTRGLDESLSKKFFWQAATAVNYLHYFGIVHRDIKLDNFLLTDDSRTDSDLRLIDFGFATHFRDQTLSSSIGTASYVAPEVLKRSYSKECDVWSLGVMLWMMIFAEPPFKGFNNSQIFDQILNKEVNFESKLGERISSGLKTLLLQLLQKDPAKRVSLSQALQSPWFNSALLEYNFQWKPFLTGELVESLREVPSYTVFQKEVIKIFVKINLDHPEFAKRGRVFCIIDYLNNGVITKHELRQVFKDFEIPVSQDECDHIIARMFLRAEEVITYSEFIAATISKRFFEEDKFLRPVFDRIDVDGGGVITFDNIRDCFQRFGYALDKQTIDGFIQEFDSSKDGTITYEEFKNIMQRS